MFLGMEAAAAVCWVALGFLGKSQFWMAVWIVQFLFLLPGSMTTGVLVEHLLWQSNVSSIAQQFAWLAASIGGNALVWSMLLLGVRQARSNKSFKSDVLRPRS